MCMSLDLDAILEVADISLRKESLFVNGLIIILW